MDITAAKPAGHAGTIKALRWPLLQLAMAILLTVAVAAATSYYDRKADQALLQIQAQQAETRIRLARVNDDEREIRAKINRYQELFNAGRIAPEQRLEWVESLRQIKTARRLQSLDYEIGPQRPLDEKSPVSSGGYTFLTSPMQLKLPLLHEHDLLGLLTDLSAQVPALISVRSCTLERSTSDTSQSPAAHLNARCEIDWITLQEDT